MLGRLVIALWLLLVPAGAWAQAISCHAEGASLEVPASRAAGERRVVPIGGYLLALAWSPEYCRTRGDSPRDAVECGRGERFGFVLHGLWPEGKGAAWPQWCRTVAPLPPALVRRNLCVMPSAALQQHEWAAHGSCTGDDPQRYFADATRLFAGLTFPDMDALSRQEAGAGALARAFAAANPRLPAAAVRIVANRRGWLEEVRICLDLDKRAVPCPASARAGDSGAGPLKIWRGGRARADGRLARSPRRRDDDDRDDRG